MKSSVRSPPLDLEGLRTTQEDIEALRRRSDRAPASFEAYLRFLASLGDADPAALRVKRGPRGPERFVL